MKNEKKRNRYPGIITTTEIKMKNENVVHLVRTYDMCADCAHTATESMQYVPVYQVRTYQVCTGHRCVRGWKTRSLACAGKHVKHR